MKVNYSLLDYDNTFVTHVIRQIEYIETGQLMLVLVVYSSFTKSAIICDIYIYMYVYIYIIDIKKVDKQLTHAIHVKDRYVNGTLSIN